MAALLYSGGCNSHIGLVGLVTGPLTTTCGGTIRLTGAGGIALVGGVCSGGGWSNS